MAVFDSDAWLDGFIETGEFTFEWDAGNRTKNWARHGVTTEECEEVFLTGSLPVGVQVDPPTGEPRYAVVGETLALRALFVVFTIRHGKIRVVSAREMTETEREDYDLLR